jgi:hypothetical protein
MARTTKEEKARREKGDGIKIGVWKDIKQVQTVFKD